jgi:uncharacterized membrane protein YgcG
VVFLVDSDINVYRVVVDAGNAKTLYVDSNWKGGASMTSFGGGNFGGGGASGTWVAVL